LGAALAKRLHEKNNHLFYVICLGKVTFGFKTRKTNFCPFIDFCGTKEDKKDKENKRQRVDVVVVVKKGSQVVAALSVS